jgi:biopolymer transport protein ExbD
MRKVDAVNIEVDMVPLIDIISLLLMFLVMVGDMAKATHGVQMKLPRADQAKTDKEVDSKNRLVVQLEHADGKYWATVERNRYTLEAQGGNKALIDYLNQNIMSRKAHNPEACKEDENGGLLFPVKLRIPADAPMREAERLIQSMAQAKLVNIQYAADPPKH